MAEVKSPASHRERGSLGARARWDRDAAARGAPTGPRVVRLDALDDVTRGIVLAIITARKNTASPGDGHE